MTALSNNDPSDESRFAGIDLEQLDHNLALTREKRLRRREHALELVRRIERQVADVSDFVAPASAIIWVQRGNRLTLIGS